MKNRIICLLVCGVFAAGLAGVVNAQVEPVPPGQEVALSGFGLPGPGVYMLAQADATEYVAVGSALPLERAAVELPGWLKALTDKFSWLGTVLIMMGAFRVVLKPLVSAVRGYIASTPDPADDAWLAKVEASPVGGVVLWVIDYITSIKLTGVRR